jgi:hypothetical protein
MAKKLILSTGNAEDDAKKLAELRGEDSRLVNRTTFEEDKEKLRKANEDAAKQEPSRNALTDTPHIEGQVIAVVDDGEPESQPQPQPIPAPGDDTPAPLPPRGIENRPVQAPAQTETEELKHMGVKTTPVVPSTGVPLKTDGSRFNK